jgi:ABC-type Na+ efflux pump permease subunit
MEQFDVSLELVMLIILALVIILFVMSIILWVKLSAMRKNYKRLLNGTNPVNVEELLINIQQKQSQQIEQTAVLTTKVDAFKEAIKKMKSKIGVHRYNAFSDTGSDLSFSVAILDEFQDGVLLTGIHNREQTYIYAKPVQNGQSQYTLSPEEIEAINQTLKQR